MFKRIISGIDQLAAQIEQSGYRIGESIGKEVGLTIAQRESEKNARDESEKTVSAALDKVYEALGQKRYDTPQIKACIAVIRQALQAMPQDSKESTQYDMIIQTTKNWMAHNAPSIVK